MQDLIDRQAAIEVTDAVWCVTGDKNVAKVWDKIRNLPSVQPERLTDDDFETIRIHLSAYKEKLCNQHRWEEAEEYQRIIDRFMTFASAQPKKGKWVRIVKHHKDAEQEYSYNEISCSECGAIRKIGWRDARFCPNCGAYMETEYD